jgi:tetraacyldisaccharide 4'-kinase
MSLSGRLADRLVAAWYAPEVTPLAASLVPLSILFGAGVALRRAAYRVGLLRASRLPVPVIVVGNLTVGGSGKTPLALALGRALRDRGRHPAIVSRGFGGSNVAPHAVAPGDDPRVVGDEPLLHAAAGFPVWIGRRRADAARALLAANPEVDVVIADDGLQHYALARTVEIVVVDATLGYGNGIMLPAGPLREPMSRADEADAMVRLVTSDATPSVGREFDMQLEPQPWRNLVRPGLVADPREWVAGSVHAIAGIGNPERFFALLRAQGIDAQCHPFPDHHTFAPSDLAFAGARVILMTEKDAVKCVAFADQRCWCLPVRARIDPALVEHVIARIHGFETA